MFLKILALTGGLTIGCGLDVNAGRGIAETRKPTAKPAATQTERKPAPSSPATTATKSAATPAAPASVASRDATASPAASAISDIKYLIKSLAKKLNNDNRWWGREKNHYYVKRDLKKAKARLAQIRREDPSWDISGYEKVVASISARLKGLQDAATAKAARGDNMRTLATQFKKELKELVEIRAITSYAKQRGSAPSRHSSRKALLVGAKQLPKLQALLQKCKDQYLAVMKDRSSQMNGWGFVKKDERATCGWDFETRKGLMQKLVRKKFDKLADSMIRVAKGNLDELAETGKWDGKLGKSYADSNTGAQARRDAWVPFNVALGFELPVEKFQAAEDYWNANFDKALKKAARKRRFKKGKKRDRKSLKLVKKSLKAKGMKVYRVTNTGGWTITKNGVGIPKYRKIGVRAMVRRKGEKFCRIYDQPTVKQEYAGGGRWAKDREIDYDINDDDSFVVSRCK